ncbi:MAG: DUF721 domain-containing protein [Actinomycetota bacterium]|nr:DUF721 domain-containing protein [Actinomycetota bacterium]
MGNRDREDHRPPARVGDLIDGVLANVAPVEVATIVRLRRDWSHVAGPWSTRCRPVALRDGVLTVVVGSGLEATRLRYEAAALADRLSAALGAGAEVSRVAIRVATEADRRASTVFEAELRERPS